jgi:hypothetical protein
MQTVLSGHAHKFSHKYTGAYTQARLSQSHSFHAITEAISTVAVFITNKVRGRTASSNTNNCPTLRKRREMKTRITFISGVKALIVRRIIIS